MFKKVLVPVDLQQSKATAALLEVAGRFHRELGCPIHVMTVMPGYSMPIVASYFPADAKATAKKEVERKLKSLVENKLGSAKITCSVSEGKRGEEILKAAKRRKVDLILIGCLRHGRFEDALLGSVGSKVAQRAECSVMVVRQ